MSEKWNLNNVYQILLVILAFLMPLTVFGANLIIVFICILWLVSGDYKSKYNQIISNKLMLASIIFFCIHVVGLLWTEDLAWGLHMVHKMWYFLLLLPVLFTIVRKKNISLYISAFLLAITVTEIASYLVWFELVEPFKNATVINPTPFMSHISYNPILAFAIYLILHEIFFNKKLQNFIFYLYIFFAISMTINMFITGGRAGQVGFFVILLILIFQILEKKIIKTVIVSLIIIPGIFVTSYQTSDLFHLRVNTALSEAINYDTNQANSSVGLRIRVALNSLEIINKNPIFGVGTGDFPNEYAKVYQINSPESIAVTNPHNMYVLVLVQLGLLGLISMFSIFYYQIKLSFSSSSKFIQDVGITLPLIFLVLSLSDSYLLGHYTTLLFIFFSSFLYNEFEND